MQPKVQRSNLETYGLTSNHPVTKKEHTRFKAVVFFYHFIYHFFKTVLWEYIYSKIYFILLAA